MLLTKSKNASVNLQIDTPKLLDSIDSLPIENVHNLLQNSLAEIQNITFTRQKSSLLFKIAMIFVGLIVSIVILFMAYKLYPRFKVKFMTPKTAQNDSNSPEETVELNAVSIPDQSQQSVSTNYPSYS